MNVRSPRRRTSRRSGSRARAAVAVLAALCLALAACSGGGGGGGRSTPSSATPSATGPSGSARAALVIRDFAFVPADPTVAPGGRVTVTNEDSVTHTVTAAGGDAFDTGDIAPGATATFTAPGERGGYPYTCTIHPSMLGTLVVG
ncbi:cupredoxin domain-containing protein [Streptomyces uncialis]|uniref:cupredoxin domain-containing protein n=1 Tax=Streptomyces uncialis TaxID=1048205 RepID=UPI0037F5B898